MLALQTSASLQRSHSNFWICLSQAYRKLREATLVFCGSTGCSVADTETLSVVLAQTVQLFRPYFTWRPRTGASEAQVSHPSTSSGEVADIKGMASRDRDAPSSACQVAQSPGEETLFAHQSTTKSGNTPSWEGATCEDPPLCVRKDSGARNCSGDHSSPVNSSDSCAEPCVFSSVGVSQDPSYVQTFRKLAVKYDALPVTHKLLTRHQGLLPDLDLPLCCRHSPFVMLVRLLLRPEEFPALSDALHGEGLSGVAHQLWASVYAMAECSCLVWAR